MRSVPTHDQSFCRHFSPLLRGRRWLLLLCVVLNWGALSGQISFAEPTELTTDQNLAPQSSPTGALTEFVSTQGTLFLKDGRELEGQLAGVTDYQVNWTVATGQTISFPLTMVQRLEMGSAPEEKEKSDQTTSPLTPPEEVFPTPSNSGLIEPSGLEEAVPEPIALSDEELEAGSTGEAPASEEPAEGDQKPSDDADSIEEEFFELTDWEETVVSPLPEPVTFSYRFSRQQVKEWTKRFEIGARQLDGNSEETSLNADARLENRCFDYTTRIDLGSKWGQAKGVQVSNQVFGNANIDIGEVGSWIFYVTNQNQYDELQDLDYRGSLSAGVGYRFLDDEERRLITRIGPGVTAEEYHTPGNDRVTADIFAEIETQWPLYDRTHFEGKFNIRPSVEDYEIFRFTNDMAVLVQLDEESTWQLKLGLNHQYNSQPAINRKKSDFTTVFQLVYTLK